MNHWVYRCDPCEFDAHLKCAKRPLVVQQLGTKVQKNQQANQVCKSTSVHNSTQIVHQQPLETESSRQLHGYHTAPVYLTQGFVHTAVPAYPTQGFVQGPMRNNTVENIVQSVIEGLIEGGASQIGQASCKVHLETDIYIFHVLSTSCLFLTAFHRHIMAFLSCESLCLVVCCVNYVAGNAMI